MNPCASHSVIPSVSGAVLAGGNSSRMGRDKAFLEFKGVPLISLQAARLREAGCAEILISGRPRTEYPVARARIIHDPHPGLGPMAGLLSVLQAATHDHVLVIAVDLPELTVAWLSCLAACPDSPAGTVFRQNGFFEPLAALYPRSLAGLCAEHLARKQLSLQLLLREAIADRLMVARDLPQNETHLLNNWNEPGDKA